MTHSVYTADIRLFKPEIFRSKNVNVKQVVFFVSFHIYTKNVKKESYVLYKEDATTCDTTHTTVFGRLSKKPHQKRAFCRNKYFD